MRKAMLLLGAVAALCLGCEKKESAVKPERLTVLTGYYSLVQVYAIAAPGTYREEPTPPCLTAFSLYLGGNGHMSFQDACVDTDGTWAYRDSVLTLTDKGGSVLMSGRVDFEPDGITIEVNSTVDNTRYRLWRN